MWGGGDIKAMFFLMHPFHVDCSMRLDVQTFPFTFLLGLWGKFSVSLCFAIKRKIGVTDRFRVNLGGYFYFFEE